MLRRYSLLHLTARVKSEDLRDIHSLHYLIKTEICISLISFEANIYATDATYKTPMGIEIEAH